MTDKATPTPSPATVDSVMALAEVHSLAAFHDGRNNDNRRSQKHIDAYDALHAEAERLAAQSAPSELKDSASQLRKVLGISQDFSDWPYAKLMDAATKHILSTFDKPEEFTQGVNAAAKMLDKMADDFSNQHAWTDPDTGVAELTGAKEEYYNTLRELADSVRSIVHEPKKGNSHGRS